MVPLSLEVILSHKELITIGKIEMRWGNEIWYVRSKPPCKGEAKRKNGPHNRQNVVMHKVEISPLTLKAGSLKGRKIYINSLMFISLLLLVVCFVVMGIVLKHKNKNTHHDN
uniref:Uncharacterized protein n=1 Tax=Glossina brevipalpis TaxID=37001 RepID=A0A1A9WZ60_9MUSC